MFYTIQKTMILGFSAFLLICIPHIFADLTESYHIRDGLHVPCSFFDTVNITGDHKFPNGSYLHDGVIIPPHLIGLYDYVYKDMATRLDTESHMRGCICKLKTCINFCCPWGLSYSPSEKMCVKDVNHQWPEQTINITTSNDTYETVNIFEYFAVQDFRPCTFMYQLVPEAIPYDGWKIFENGSLWIEEDGVFMNKYEFCLMPTTINDTDELFIINPALCDIAADYGIVKIINAYTMLFSIPFMFLTIVVYLAIPELRNRHGKSLVCYLIGLIIGYSLLSYISLTTEILATGVNCKIIGYTAYYFFMASFFWLSVISFDLWHNFRGTRGINRFSKKKRFLMYSLYAWGLAAVFLIFTCIVQELTDIPDVYKPGIGGGQYCWVDMSTWSAMIYFFGPIIVIIAANLVMFIMTAMKIHKVQREMARIMAREDSTRNLRSEKDKFGLFFRLFIVMGVTWTLEILSYIVGTNSPWAKLFYISDICNAIQGFLIFMLFVMKKKVKDLITNRCSSVLEGTSNQRQSQYSTKTTSSSVGNLTMTNIAEKPLMHSQDQRK